MGEPGRRGITRSPKTQNSDLVGCCRDDDTVHFETASSFTRLLLQIAQLNFFFGWRRPTGRNRFPFGRRIHFGRSDGRPITDGAQTAPRDRLWVQNDFVFFDINDRVAFPATATARRARPVIQIEI